MDWIYIVYVPCVVLIACLVVWAAFGFPRPSKNTLKQICQNYFSFTKKEMLVFLIICVVLCAGGYVFYLYDKKRQFENSLPPSTLPIPPPSEPYLPDDPKYNKLRDIMG